MKRIVVIPDTQLPYDDRKALKAIIRFIGDFQPDEVIHIGDVMDFPQPSRWNKDTAGEFQGSVFKDCADAKRRLLEPLRAVYDGPVGMHEGNHDERPRTYLAKYAPALAESDAFNLDKLLDFDSFGIKMLPEFNPIAPGWITTHGHKGQITLSRVGGSTALGAAAKFGKSVVMGHTHRLAAKALTNGYGGKVGREVWGMEVGHLMDMKQAHYLKGGTANWQQGFAVLNIEGTYVKPEIIPISKGRFTVDATTWEV
jgi:predicted phosphodiesterase